jgi:hypothetical protein
MKTLFVLVLSLMLVACGGKPAQTSTSNGTNTETAVSNSRPSPTGTGNSSQATLGLDSFVVPPYYTDEDPMVDDNLELGNGVVLFNFAQREAISSPLELSGVAPRNWYFEGIVPITILDLEENVIAEGYGSGEWLLPLPGEDELRADDPVGFYANIEFTAPAVEVDMGKIRIEKDKTGAEEPNYEPAMVETMILWAD